MLGNVFINKINARQYLSCNIYIKVYIVGKVFSILSTSLLCIHRNPSHLISKQLGRKIFQWSNFQMIPIHATTM